MSANDNSVERARTDDKKQQPCLTHFSPSLGRNTQILKDVVVNGKNIGDTQEQSHEAKKRCQTAHNENIRISTKQEQDQKDCSRDREIKLLRDKALADSNEIKRLKERIEVLTKVDKQREGRQVGDNSGDGVTSQENGVCTVGKDDLEGVQVVSERIISQEINILESASIISEDTKAKEEKEEEGLDKDISEMIDQILVELTEEAQKELKLLVKEEGQNGDGNTEQIQDSIASKQSEIVENQYNAEELLQEQKICYELKYAQLLHKMQQTESFYQSQRKLDLLDNERLSRQMITAESKLSLANLRNAALLSDKQILLGKLAEAELRGEAQQKKYADIALKFQQELNRIAEKLELRECELQESTQKRLQYSEKLKEYSEILSEYRERLQSTERELAEQRASISEPIQNINMVFNIIANYKSTLHRFETEIGQLIGEHRKEEDIAASLKGQLQMKNALLIDCCRMLKDSKIKMARILKVNSMQRRILQRWQKGERQELVIVLSEEEREWLKEEGDKDISLVSNDGIISKEIQNNAAEIHKEQDKYQSETNQQSQSNANSNNLVSQEQAQSEKISKKAQSTGENGLQGSKHASTVEQYVMDMVEKAQNKQFEMSILINRSASGQEGQYGYEESQKQQQEIDSQQDNQRSDSQQELEQGQQFLL